MTIATDGSHCTCGVNECMLSEIQPVDQCLHAQAIKNMNRLAVFSESIGSGHGGSVHIKTEVL